MHICNVAATDHFLCSMGKRARSEAWVRSGKSSNISFHSISISFLYASNRRSSDPNHGTRVRCRKCTSPLLNPGPGSISRFIFGYVFISLLVLLFIPIMVWKAKEATRFQAQAGLNWGQDSYENARIWPPDCHWTLIGCCLFRASNLIFIRTNIIKFVHYVPRQYITNQSHPHVVSQFLVRHRAVHAFSITICPGILI